MLKEISLDEEASYLSSALKQVAGKQLVTLVLSKAKNPMSGHSDLFLIQLC